MAIMAIDYQTGVAAAVKDVLTLVPKLLVSPPAATVTPRPTHADTGTGLTLIDLGTSSRDDAVKQSAQGTLRRFARFGV